MVSRIYTAESSLTTATSLHFSLYLESHCITIEPFDLWRFWSKLSSPMRSFSWGAGCGIYFCTVLPRLPPWKAEVWGQRVRNALPLATRIWNPSRSAAEGLIFHIDLLTCGSMRPRHNLWFGAHAAKAFVQLLVGLNPPAIVPSAFCLLPPAFCLRSSPVPPRLARDFPLAS